MQGSGMGVANCSMQVDLQLQWLKNSTGSHCGPIPSSSKKRQQLGIQQPVCNCFTVTKELLIALQQKMDRWINR